MRRPALLVVLLAILSVTASGCWDRIEIEQETVILALGVDTGRKPDEYTVSAQIAVLGSIPLGGMGGGAGAGGGRPMQPATVMASTGTTVGEALSHLQQRVQWPVFLGYVHVIAVSEEVARQGVQPILDFARRVPEMRRPLWLVVVQGDARKLLEIRPKLEMLPVFFVTNLLNTMVRRGRMSENDLLEYVVRLRNPGEEPAAPRVRVVGDEVEWRGLAVFAGDRMVGTLDPVEAHLAVSLRKEGADLSEQDLKVGPDLVRLRNSFRETRIRPELTASGPVIRVAVTYRAHVEEVVGSLALDEPGMLERIEKKAARDLKIRLSQTLSKLQAMGTDILGYGEVVRGRLPQAWKTMAGAPYFRTLPVELSVKVSINRIGMVAR